MGLGDGDDDDDDNNDTEIPVWTLSTVKPREGSPLLRLSFFINRMGV